MPTDTLNFDENGFLKPHQLLEVTIDTFEDYFVKKFPTSKTRHELFDNYKRYIYRFQDEIFPFFEQWINGSFISQKMNPKDIDFVTFIDYRVFELRYHLLDEFIASSLEHQGLDAYIARTYPTEHSNYSSYLQNKMKWTNLYQTTRIDNQNNFYSKGFIKIVFDYEG